MALKILLVLVAFGVASVLCDDYEEDAVYKQEHCIKITPEKKKQLEVVILEIADFFSQLTMKHEDIDVRFVRVDIEKHSEDEVDEKDMILKVNINDCHEHEKPQNHDPNDEQHKINTGHNDTVVDIQINNESEDVAQEVPSENKNNQKQDQETYYEENVNENKNVEKIGSQNQEEQSYVNTNANFDNTDNQRQNQMQTQQETSVGYVNQNKQGQGEYESNNQLAGCNYKEDTSTGLDLDKGDNDVDDDITKLIKDFDFISAVSVQRPTVTIMHMPQNGQDFLNFMERRKKKKIEPLWVYMLEEDNKKEFVVFQ